VLFTLLNQVVNGIALGLLFALMAVGLSITLGLMRVINMAHGALYTLGAYAVVTTWSHLGFAAALLAATVAVGVIGFLLEAVLIRPLYARDPLHTMLLTFGLALIVEDLVRIGWGDAPYPLSAPPSLAGIVMLGDVPFSRYRLFVIAVTAVLMLLTWLFLEKTLLGRTARWSASSASASTSSSPWSSASGRPWPGWPARSPPRSGASSPPWEPRSSCRPSWW
jgi:branched-chain amino acid transport system permease protein